MSRFDFSTVPGWAWGIRPMNVVRQTVDCYLDKEMEELIAELGNQAHCERLAICFTIIALEALLEQELQDMTLHQRLNIERARLGYKFPITVKEIDAAEKESNSIPNTCPVACTLDGKTGIFALHNFEDGDVWLVRLDDHSDNWVTMRNATESDKRLIQSLHQGMYGLGDEDSWNPN